MIPEASSSSGPGDEGPAGKAAVAGVELDDVLVPGRTFVPGASPVLVDVRDEPDTRVPGAARLPLSQLEERMSAGRARWRACRYFSR